MEKMSAWKVLKDAAAGYVEHEALTRGAAIAFYAVTSLAPVLLVIVAIAGLFLGQDVVRTGLVEQVSALMGNEGGDLIRTMLTQAADKGSSTWVSLLGGAMVIFTASGVFSEIQAALNRTWGGPSPDSEQPWFSIIRARAVGLGLVLALGFLLIVSLAASTAVSALGDYLGRQSQIVPLLLSGANTVVSVLLFTLLFSAIYKVLPNTDHGWGVVIAGSAVTALLFTIGKSLIGWYLGTMAVSSPYGASGAVILVLLWAYYSSQILLFGAELTRAMSGRKLPRHSAA